MPGIGVQPPKGGGPNIALIIIIVMAVLCATGLGGCLICTCLATRSGSTSSSSSPSGGSFSPSKGNTGTVAGSDNWITSERPYVKFLAPPGWNKNIKGEWGVFKSPDGAAVFAFTTFTQPGESTTRLGAAAGVLGVVDIDWKSPKYGTIGKDNFDARMGEGSCNFRGPNGYIWYATVNSGTSDQILLIYTVSASGTQADKDAALTAIRSLQRR